MPIFQDKEQEKKLETLHKKEEEELASILSQKYGLNYIDLSRKPIDTDALKLIAEKEAREAGMAAFKKIGKKLHIAIRTPNNEKVAGIVESLKDRGFVTDLYMVSTASLDRAWERYKDISFAVETKAGVLDISGIGIKKILESMKSLGDVKTQIDEILAMKKAYRISRALETILAGALANKASDIHVEPEEGYTRLRFRLDGVLTDITRFNQDTYNLILSRIKLLSGLKLNIKNTAQDGRFSVVINGKEIEIRTSILPGAYGESIVLRLLSPESLTIPFAKLGMEHKLIEIVNTVLKKPNGMILTTGPTGSGKTTTLYSFLKYIHTPEIKIVTIEDPIEYHLPGIVQTQVEKDYTFSKGLTSTLRQDPDVIMVGEIRDTEVAETALHASLTGHLVLSTLHTNTAAGAIPRLIDLGINPKILGSALKLVMAQRLVRVLKKDKAKEVELTGKAKEFIDNVLASIPDKSLIPKNTTKVWKPVEEIVDGELVYEGRIGVFEAFEMNAEIENLIKENPSERDMAKLINKQGLLTMVQDGVIKALNGITSLSELERVLDADIS